MIGLMLLGVIGLYLALSIGVIVLVGKWAKKRGRRRWLWCTATGFVMYLLVAWEQIPTYLIGKHYCETQAGLTVYKTPEQWLAENPGVEHTLVRRKSVLSKYIHEGELNAPMNQRLVYSFRRYLMSALPVNIDTSEVYDNYDGSLLVKQVSVSTGYGRRGSAGLWAYKIWAGTLLCDPGFPESIRIIDEFSKIGREAD